MLRIFLALTFAALVAGCATRGHPISEDALSKIVVGETKYSDMVGMFGDPVYQGYGNNGALSANWMYIKTGFGGLGMHQQVLGVKFNNDKTVDQYNLSQTSP